MNPNIRLIPLHGKHGSGLFAKVDAHQYEKLSRYRWYVHKNDKVEHLLYAVRKARTAEGKRWESPMHREVLGLSREDPRRVDHRDNDGLNNTELNLRFCSGTQNMANQRPQKGRSSRFKGVSFRKDGRWRACIQVERQHLSIGAYESEDEAAKAYDAAARYYFGDFAHTNFQGTAALPAETLRALRACEPFRKGTRGNDLYIGVYYKASLTKPYVAHFSFQNRLLHIGCFDTPEEASLARSAFAKNLLLNQDCSAMQP